MARSDDNQWMGSVNLHDYGFVTLGADGTVAVTTNLAQVRFGEAGFKSGNIVASTLLVSGLSSMTVTITDSAGAINAGAIVWYQFIGA